MQWRSLLTPKVKANASYGQASLAVKGDLGHDFVLSIRTANQNPLDFSVVLAFVDSTRHEYNLIRHNGVHKSDHTNVIEDRLGLPDSVLRNVFHIHKATERYQLKNLPIEAFAERTKLYSDVEGATHLMVTSYGFVIETSGTKLPLYDLSPELQ